MSRANPRFKRINPPLSFYVNPIYLLTVSGLVDGQRWAMTMEFLGAAGAIPATAEQSICNTFETSCVPSLKACMAADATVDTVKVSCMSSPSRLPYVDQGYVGFGAGTVAGNHLPSEMAGIIAKYTTLKGQHGRGRMYLPAVPISFTAPATSANLLTPAALAIYLTFAASLNSALITDGTNPVTIGLATRTKGGAPWTQAQPVTRLLVRALLGTVRRRRIGRGK